MPIKDLVNLSEAIEVMDSIIARNEDRAGSYYDAACLYARMGQKQKPWSIWGNH